MATPTYWDYLQLDKLLDQQGGFGGEVTPDELHFIIVHQAYELWFKLILSQLRLARDHLAAPHLPEERVPFVVHHLGRVNEILKLCVDQFRVMETLPPQDFLDFREKLTPSSGFQSFQMREMEMVLGLPESQRIPYGNVHPLAHIRSFGEATPAALLARARIEAASEETTLRDALIRWLARTPIQGSSPGDAGDDAAVDAFVASYLGQAEVHQRGGVDALAGTLGEEERARISERVEAGLLGSRTFLLPDDREARRARAALLFIESYRELPLLAWPRLLLDTVVELEEQLLLWRNRHARMVERTIGRRIGTGGSSGVDYLDKTTQQRIFPELWAVRTTLLPRNQLPPLVAPERYGFAG
ncbi:MAG: tryptophan 2,3-dioxygenase family protein [Pseudomonadota bacterium]|nr:tryptophan 2,3-dioxygenase family protein [Pseudomonadota bacterium]